MLKFKHKNYNLKEMHITNFQKVLSFVNRTSGEIF